MELPPLDFHPDGTIRVHRVDHSALQNVNVDSPKLNRKTKRVYSGGFELPALDFNADGTLRLHDSRKSHDYSGYIQNSGDFVGLNSLKVQTQMLFGIILMALLLYVATSL